MVRSIGADHVVDYTHGDLTDLEQRYDVIFQPAGTKSPLRLRRLLMLEGTLVLSSGMSRLSGIDCILKAMATSRFVNQRLVSWVADVNRDDLLVRSELLESGQVKPVIGRA